MKQKRLYPDTNKDDQALDPYWDAVRASRYKSTADDLPDYLSPQNRNRMKNEMTASRPLRFLSMRAAVIALCLAGAVTACMVPVESSEPVGKVVAFRVPADDKGSLSAIKGLFAGRKHTLTQASAPDGSLKLTYVLPGMKDGEAEHLLSNLSRSAGVHDMKVQTLSATVHESLASNILYRVFHTRINATEMTDDALKASIEQQLAQSGLNGFDVTIRHTDHGRAFEIRPNAANQEDFALDVTVDDNGGQVREVIRRQRGEAGSLPRMGRTDQDIKNMIKANHPEMSLTDEDITIVRNGDEATVTINKDGREMELKLMMKHKAEEAP